MAARGPRVFETVLVTPGHNRLFGLRDVLGDRAFAESRVTLIE